jgi:thymidylate kinase
MLHTKLILIEGLPGAGKSTTTQRIGMRLQQAGLACRWYLEEDEPHPIACLDFLLKELPQKLPPLWHTFAQQALKAPDITIMESRLWQNTAFFMYMGDFPVSAIRELQHQVWQVLTPLSPVLVYLDQDNVESALQRLYSFREEALVNAAIQMTSTYPWFQRRGLNDVSGWVQFFQEWQRVAEQLYDDWPAVKLRVVNAHAAWETTYQQIDHHLQLEPSV